MPVIGDQPSAGLSVSDQLSAGVRSALSWCQTSSQLVSDQLSAGFCDQSELLWPCQTSLQLSRQTSFQLVSDQLFAGVGSAFSWFQTSSRLVSDQPSAGVRPALGWCQTSPRLISVTSLMCSGPVRPALSWCSILPGPALSGRVQGDIPIAT